MTFERQQGVIPKHAAAVVSDANHSPAAGLHLHAQRIRACIQRIFEEFFDHRGGPLHNFTGRDFVRNLVGKNANTAHEGFYFKFQVLDYIDSAASSGR